VGVRLPLSAPNVVSQDIVDTCLTTSWTNLGLPKGDACGVEGELANQGAVLGQDPDLCIGDQQPHPLAGIGAADGDVAEPAQVAEGDPARAVYAVLANAEVDGWNRGLGACLEAGVEGDEGGPAVEGAMGALLVVIGTEGIELELQHGHRGGGGLFGEEPLEGLVEALDLAAGLGVVGRRVLGLNAQQVELGFEHDLAPAGVGGEDGAVGFLIHVKPSRRG